jgi:predicted kinase
MPVLYIFSGLPASGKSTLARELARAREAVYVRIDTIEQTLKGLGTRKVETEGYEIGYRLAEDNLRVGLSVVADSCNTIILTRKAWERVAAESGADFINIEIVCSDKAEHQRRVEERFGGAAPGTHVRWLEVEGREYHSWSQPRLVIDTAGKSARESFDDLCRELTSTISGRSLTPPPPTPSLG